MFTTTLKLIDSHFLSTVHTHTVQWFWVSVCLSTMNHPPPTPGNDIVGCTLRCALTSINEYTISYKTAFQQMFVASFCKWWHPAFSLSSWPWQSLSPWRGWVVADSLWNLSLMVTTWWQDRLSSATQCSDIKENMLIGSSPSSVKRQSGLSLKCPSSL